MELDSIVISVDDARDMSSIVAVHQGLVSARNEILQNLNISPDSTFSSSLDVHSTPIVSSSSSSLAEACIDESSLRLEKKFEILQQAKTSSISERALAEQYGLSRKQVHNILSGHSRLDGSTKPGRRTSLLPSTEVLLAREIAWLLQEKEVSLTGEDLSKYCQALWRAEGNTGEPPKFGKNFRKAFNERHPNLRFEAFRVAPKTQRRQAAATFQNIATFMNSLKHFFLGTVQSKYVFTVDEFDASANDKGIGERRFAVGNIRPTHTTTNKTPHVSAVPFIPLSGDSGYTAFVVQGAKKTISKGDDMDILYNSKGSVDSNTWRDIIQRFANYVDKTFFEYRKARQELIYLLFDGYQAHKDVVALGILESHGIKALCIPPNLTHVIQINDHGRINGKIQQTVRARKQGISRLNGGKMLPLDKWCDEVRGIIWSVVNRVSIAEAAKSIGIVHTHDFATISMSNASIEEALQILLRSGRITDKRTEREQDFVVLRDGDYVNGLQRKNLPGWGERSRHISERAVEAIAAYSDQLVFERTGERPTKRIKRQYRRVVSKSAAKPAEVKVVADPEIGMARRKQQLMEASQQAKLEKQRENLAKREEQAKRKEEKRIRLEELSQRFPDVDLQPYLRSLSRYLCGSQSLERAIKLLERKFSIEVNKSRISYDDAM